MPFKFHCNFTYVSETYDFIELYYDLWRFIPDLADPGLSSTISQFNPNIPGEGGRGEGVCITANGNILANGNLCFTVTKLQLKVINEKFCYLYSAWVNQIN